MRRFDFRRFVDEYAITLGPIALAALVAGGIRYLVWRQWDAWTIGMLAGGAVLGALFIVLNPTQVRDALTSRGTRYGANALAISVAFIAIMVGLNYLAGRYHYRFDTTELQVHTLSPQTIQVLDDIDQDVSIVGFFAADEFSRQKGFDDLLNQYVDRSGRLDYTVIDPDRDPVVVQQYEPPYSGLILQSGERNERVYTASEQEITSALLKVTREGKKTIYFLTGHQEHDPDGVDGAGYGDVVNALRDQNYDVLTLNLAISDTVPSNASVLVIAGPQKALLDEEIATVREYLSRGGKALIMQDPLPDMDNVGLNTLLADWQVGFGDGVVVDLASAAQMSPAYPAVLSYSFSQITQGLNGLTSIFPMSRPIVQTVEDPQGGISIRPLAETSTRSWSETGEEIAQDEADIPGPLTLMVIVESPPLDAEVAGANPDLKTRMVLVGDSDFAANDFVTVPGNGVLALNTINWLSEEESLIAIGPKDAMPRYVFLSDLQMTLVFFVGIIVIPAVLLTAGIIVWVMRRRR